MAAAAAAPSNVRVVLERGPERGRVEEGSIGVGAINITMARVSCAVTSHAENAALIKRGALVVDGIPSGAVVTIRRVIELMYDRYSGDEKTPPAGANVQIVNGVPRDLDGPPVMDHTGCVVGRHSKHFHGDEKELLPIIMAVRKERGDTDGFGLNGKFYA